MNFSNVKTVLSVGVIGLAVALLAAFGRAEPTVVEAMDPAFRADKLPVSMAAEEATPVKSMNPLSRPKPAESVVSAAEEAASPAYEAGTLLEGSDHFIYYVTEAGTRQPIYDRETFLAFGFQAEEVIKANDQVLARIPLDHVLTRLVFDDQDNLYWVVDGQRWQVNAWKQVLNEESYQGLPTSPLDRSLVEVLPLRSGLKSNTFLRQDETVYYFTDWTLIPLKENSYDERQVIEVPSGVLAIYPQQARLETMFTRLKADTPAANVRRGPGLEFEVIGTIYDTNRIIVKGRAENSYWLQIKYQGQLAWLAGDLVKDQSLLNLLPTIDTNSLKPEKVSRQQTNNANIYTGIGARLDTGNGSPVVIGLVEGGPAQRSGLAVGDVIVEVDGQTVTGLSLYEVIGRIRGEKGVEVILTVLRPETNERLAIPIVRDEINLSAVTWTCNADPIRGFGKVWREHPEVHKWLGCPFTNWRRDEHATRAAVQIFEHGWMLWLETDTVANVDPIYVFFEDDSSYIRYGDRPLTDAHQYAPTPAGFYKVGDRFAKVYWEEIGPQGRERLGRATNEARDSLGAFQEFEHGRMFWAGEADIIYAIYQGRYDFDGDGETTYVRGWTSFEDTFEDPAEE